MTQSLDYLGRGGAMLLDGIRGGEILGGGCFNVIQGH